YWNEMCHLPRARWKRCVPRGFHCFGASLTAICATPLLRKPLGTHRFQRALGKRLTGMKCVTCREHAGSDAYPGVFIVSGRRSLRYARLLSSENPWVRIASSVLSARGLLE